MVHRLRLAIAALLVLAASCRNATVPPHAIDPSMASCVPSTATLLAGIHLTRLRSSPLYPKLPPSAIALIEPLRDAQYLLLASDGRNFLVIASGAFHQPPAGATLLARGLAIAGTPDWLAAATAQHNSGKPGNANLVSDGDAVAAGSPIWAVALGGRPLPLTGNAANLNRLLRDSDHASLALQLDSPILLSATVVGRTADSARQVEETLRASITLAAAAEARQVGIVSLLRSIRLSRDDRIVNATLSASPEAVEKLLTTMGL